MVAIGGGSQSHNLNDEEARMRKLVKDRKSASRRKSKSGRRLQTSLETFDEVDPCDVDDDESHDERALGDTYDLYSGSLTHMMAG